MHHGVEGKNKPHTGPKAFAATRHNEEGKQSTTTPQAQRQGNQAVARSNRYLEGGTSNQQLDQDAQWELSEGAGGASTK